MSIEVFGDDGIGNAVTAEDLWNHGWASSADAETWWRDGEPDTTYTFDEACEAFEDWRSEE